MAEEEFDYIVVGAGSAGCVVADRLSEDGRKTVLVLEAGGRDSSPWIHIPIGYAKNLFNTKVNWCFSTEPEPELHNRSIYSPCGRVLGGSSSINGLVYIRGQREDFDSWRQDGNPGWGYEEVLPFFRKSEQQQLGASEFHGTDGPLAVSNQVTGNPLCHSFVESAKSMGIASNRDFNGATQEGVGYFQVTARKGRRISSAVAFLRRAERRENVALRVNAQVERLVMREGRAVDVIYRRGGEEMTAKARNTIILTAGALNSPAILQRSGIGRPEWLAEAGIAVSHELMGVGANLHDHLQSKLVIRSRDPVTLNDQTRSVFGLAKMALQYAVCRKGPLTSAAGQAGGFIRTRPELDRPDVQFHVMPFSSGDLRKGLDGFSGFTISACQLRPNSRGTLKIRSGKAEDHPLIRPNFLSKEIDRQTMVEGLRAARRITHTNPLASKINREERPGLDVQSDEELLSYVRETANPVYHPAGTCKMGPDADAVVDARLRVKGIAGLMVADASIMPTIVSGNTNATAIMIGERAAAFLKETA